MTDQTHSTSFPEDGDGADCPICLEKMPVSWNNKGKVHMACCGNYYCDSCAQDRVQRNSDLNSKLMSLQHHNQIFNSTEIDRLMAEHKILSNCPLCRETEPSTEEEYFQYELKRAKMGNKEAQYGVAGLYNAGKGTEKDDLKFAFWIKSSAEQGFAPAMYSYGINFENGEGCQKSQSEAVHWMAKAANAGYPPAQTKLGSYYLNGKGVKKDDEKGVYLMKPSADKGCSFADEYLAYCYMDGIGVKKDVDEAIRLYKSAAEEGSEKAQLTLAKWFMDSGEFKESLYWLEKAASQDNVHAKQLLGVVLFKQSLDEPRKLSTPYAVKMMREAAAHGEMDAYRDHLSELEEQFSLFCSNCHKRKSVDGKLLRCSRCKLLHYCSKICQKQHWKAGHKEHCCA